MKSLNLLILFLFICLCQVNAQQLNQVAYAPASVKRIFLPEEFARKPFNVFDEMGNNVLNGSISASKYWEHSGTTTCIADLTKLNIEGNYLVEVDGLATHIDFSINKNVYQKLGQSATKMFYHARASMPIEEKYGGKYARPEGHPDDKVIVHSSAASKQRPEGFTFSSPGGWYDAGDYGKYIVNSAISVFTLLHSIELYENTLSEIDLNIPESNNRVPDILDETLYNLRWMLTMQDPKDGGVYHKLTTKKFCGMVMPHKDQLPRYVVMKSTAATLDFAATMAKAYRILNGYEKDFPGLAKTCIQAAQNAWNWSKKHPDVLYQQPKDISTGAYGDRKIKDEWLWAATELYLSTRKKKYLDHIKLNNSDFDVPSWGSVATLSLYSIVNANISNKQLKEAATKNLIKLADKYFNIYTDAAYKISIVKFPWGSNGVVSNHGMMFLNAFRVSDENKYLEAADACLGYLLGANPTGYCFATGFGKKTPMHIHDRRSASDGIEEPVPGSLAGGPTLQATKDCGREKYPTDFPAMAYLDELCSYSSNELAINWNAPFAFLLWGLDAELVRNKSQRYP